MAEIVWTLVCFYGCDFATTGEPSTRLVSQIAKTQKWSILQPKTWLILGGHRRSTMKKVPVLHILASASEAKKWYAGANGKTAGPLWTKHKR